MLPQNGRRDLQFEDLVGPFIDPAHTHVIQMAARTVKCGPAAAAEDLDGAIGGIPRGVARVKLRLRR